MSRRFVLTIGFVAAAAVAAVPAITTAQSIGGGRDVTVREKARSILFVHQQRSTRGDHMATGDRVLTRQALFDASGKSIGTLFTDCVNLGAPAKVFAATLQCTASYRFADGQLVAAGVERLGAPGTSAPIVGGSGTYRAARGEVDRHAQGRLRH